MSEGASSLIDSLNRRIAELQSELADTKSEAKKRRLEVKGLREELQKTQAELQEFAEGFEALDQEYNQFKAQAEAHPSELQARIDELTGQIRTRTHRDVFDRIARDAKLRPEAVEDAWKLSGYQAESDEVDEAKLASLIGEVVKTRPHWLDTGETPPPSREGTTPRPPLQTSVDASRGARDTSPHTFRLTKDNLRDSAWMQANQKQIAEAREAGTLEIAD
jgi:FtsZ-binding cell division protein ZapB